MHMHACMQTNFRASVIRNGVPMYSIRDIKDFNSFYAGYRAVGGTPLLSDMVLCNCRVPERDLIIEKAADYAGLQDSTFSRDSQEYPCFASRSREAACPCRQQRFPPAKSNHRNFAMSWPRHVSIGPPVGVTLYTTFCLSIQVSKPRLSL